MKELGKYLIKNIRNIKHVYRPIVITPTNWSFSYLKRLDSMNIPFKSKDNYGNEFVHGDLCLPNIYVDKDNNF